MKKPEIDREDVLLWVGVIVLSVLLGLCNYGMYQLYFK